jgi:hypothetical protein
VGGGPTILQPRLKIMPNIAPLLHKKVLMLIHIDLDQFQPFYLAVLEFTQTVMMPNVPLLVTLVLLGRFFSQSSQRACFSRNTIDENVVFHIRQNKTMTTVYSHT